MCALEFEMLRLNPLLWRMSAMTQRANKYTAAQIKGHFTVPILKSHITLLYWLAFKRTVLLYSYLNKLKDEKLDQRVQEKRKAGHPQENI